MTDDVWRCLNRPAKECTCEGGPCASLGAELIEQASTAQSEIERLRARVAELEASAGWRQMEIEGLREVMGNTREMIFSARSEESEECAKIADEMADKMGVSRAGESPLNSAVLHCASVASMDIAAAIRSRT